MRQPRTLLLTLACSLLLIGGCAVAGHRSSPWEWGGGVRVAPGFAVGDAGVTLHPMASYMYLNWDGGHDNLWELGGQVRKAMASDGGTGFWAGAEAAVSRLTESTDDYDGPGISSNGWSLTALAGVPVGQSQWGINLYAGAGISNYGSSGVNIRAGVDLQPWFLKR